MAKRQRMGWLFLCLACVVVMVCTAQRMAGLHALQMDTAVTSVVASAQVQTDETSPVTPCELSAKSLLLRHPYCLKVLFWCCACCCRCWRQCGRFVYLFSHREPSRRPLSGCISDFASSVNDRTAVADC